MLPSAFTISWISTDERVSWIIPFQKRIKSSFFLISLTFPYSSLSGIDYLILSFAGIGWKNNSFGYQYRTVKIAVFGRNCCELKKRRNSCSSSCLKALANDASGYSESLSTIAEG